MRNMFPWIQFSCNNRTFMIWRSYQAITIVRWQTATIACHFVYCNIPSSFAVVAHFVSYKLEIVLSNHIVSTFNLYISSFRIRISRTKVFIHSPMWLTKINLHNFLENKIVIRAFSHIMKVWCFILQILNAFLTDLKIYIKYCHTVEKIILHVFV